MASPRPMQLVKELTDNARMDAPAARIYEFYLKTNPELLDVPIAISLLYRLIGGKNQPVIKGEIRKIEKTVLCKVIPTDPSITLPEDKRQRLETGYIEMPFYFFPESIKRVAPFDEKVSQTQITEKAVPGLATLNFMARILEHVFNKERMGFDSEQKQFINWDFENVFDHCSPFQNKPRAELAPYLSEKTHFAQSSIDSVKESKEYIEEDFAAAIKLFSTPYFVIEYLIRSFVRNRELAQALCKKVIDNISREKFKYFANPHFRNFAFEQIEKISNAFFEDLTKIFGEYDRAPFIESAKHLSSIENLELHILTSKEFNIAQIKELIKKIRIYLIHQHKDIDSPLHLADEVATMGHFKVIRDRSGPVAIDLKGNNLNGEPVGETCSQIMQAAKTHILCNAIQRKLEAKKDDYLYAIKKQERFRNFLSSHRHSSYFGFVPLFSVFSKPTTSQAIFESLDSDKTDDKKMAELLQKLQEEDKQIFSKI